MNQKLFDFFCEHYNPGAIGLIGSEDLIGLAIRKAQSPLTLDGKPSLWSHCFIFGDLRINRTGPNSSMRRSPYVFESTFSLDILRPQLRNGVQENWLGKLCDDKARYGAVIDLGLSRDEADAILSLALQLSDEQPLYPIGELIGTWWAIILKQEWRPNPFDDPHAMYCSSFVRYSYMRAGLDFISTGVSLSNTTPEHIAQAGIGMDRFEAMKT